jgi:NAD(P)-dependent dehydrogenase (short-subunit alcohol dehydrogenase family)/NH3-dependent NAD+ synthetase
MTGSKQNPQTVTIVTGGGRGIGRAIALRMARETAVIVVGRTADDLASTCSEIRSLGGDAAYLVGDVADATTAAAAVALARERGWSIANLVCNAGIAKGGPLVNFSSETWRAMFDVNVHGTFHFIQACLPEMIERKQGAISIISSTLGLKGAKNDTAYSATKFALVGMAQSLAAELKKHNIVVVPICPGFVETDMTERTVAGMVKHKGISATEARRMLAAINPQGRILKAEEVAEAVAYISATSQATEPALSGEAMDMTGACEPRILQLINWVRAQAAPARKLHIPISGGSDSALAFYLCARAYPDKVLGIYVGAPETLRCREWFEAIAPVSYETIQPGNAEIQRWARFLELSIDSGAWLVGSRNRTEEFTGLYSLASRVATFLPLASVWKSQVMTLCDLIGVPAAITASSRHADPDCGRPQAMAEIRLEKIDAYLQRHNGECTEAVLAAYKTLSEGEIAYLERVVAQNKFKQSLPNKGPAIFPA